MSSSIAYILVRKLPNEARISTADFRYRSNGSKTLLFIRSSALMPVQFTGRCQWVWKLKNINNNNNERNVICSAVFEIISSFNNNNDIPYLSLKCTYLVLKLQLGTLYIKSTEIKSIPFQRFFFEERGIKARAPGEKPHKLKLHVTSGKSENWTWATIVAAECSLYCAIPTPLVTV